MSKCMQTAKSSHHPPLLRNFHAACHARSGCGEASPEISAAAAREAYQRHCAALADSHPSDVTSSLDARDHVTALHTGRAMKTILPKAIETDAICVAAHWASSSVVHTAILEKPLTKFEVKLPAVHAHLLFF